MDRNKKYQFFIGSMKRPLIGLAGLLVLAFTLLVAANTFAQSSSQTLNAGEELEVNCSGEHLQIDIVNRTSVEVICVDGNEPPPPEPTDEPEPPTPEPTDEPEPPDPDPTPPPPEPTAEPEPPQEPEPPEPPQGGSEGIWISRDEIARLPMSGGGWDNVYSAAQKNTDNPDISDQDDDTDTYALAKAMVYARTGETKYRDEVMRSIDRAMETENGGRTLALGRNLVSFVVAADIIDLKSANPSLDARFRSWLDAVRYENLDGRTLISTHEDRPNNWGTIAGASRIAASLYLGDNADVAEAARVFKGWTGDRSAYASFKYRDESAEWMCDSGNPIGINPIGCSIEGHDVNGALPEEMYRAGGGFQWPPKYTVYAWEGMQGSVVQAELLHRAGYDAFSWSDQALRRAGDFLHRIGWDTERGDTWMPWILNKRYGTNYPAPVGGRPGKLMGWSDWTHQ